MLYVGQRQHDVDFLLGEHAVRGRESTTHVPRPPRSTLTDRHTRSFVMQPKGRK